MDAVPDLGHLATVGEFGAQIHDAGHDLLPRVGRVCSVAADDALDEELLLGGSEHGLVLVRGLGHEALRDVVADVLFQRGHGDAHVRAVRVLAQAGDLGDVRVVVPVGHGLTETFDILG